VWVLVECRDGGRWVGGGEVGGGWAVEPNKKKP